LPLREINNIGGAGEMFFQKLLALVTPNDEKKLGLKIKFSRSWFSDDPKLQEFFRKTRPIFAIEFDNNAFPTIYGKILEEEGDSEFIEIILFFQTDLESSGKIIGEFNNYQALFIFRSHRS
jgi:hypothetical protein